MCVCEFFFLRPLIPIRSRLGISINNHMCMRVSHGFLVISNQNFNLHTLQYYIRTRRFERYRFHGRFGKQFSEHLVGDRPNENRSTYSNLYAYVIYTKTKRFTRNRPRTLKTSISFCTRRFRLRVYRTRIGSNLFAATSNDHRRIRTRS